MDNYHKFLERNAVLVEKPDEFGGVWKEWRSKVDESFIALDSRVNKIYAFLSKKFPNMIFVQNAENDPRFSANIGYDPDSKKWCG